MLARAYALVALMGLASTWVLVAGEADEGGRRDGPRSWAAFAVLTVVAVHLHYSALLVLAAQVAWLATRRRWRMAAAGLLGAASILPWFLWSGSVGYAAQQNLVWIPPFSDQTVALWLTTQLVDLDLRWMSPGALALRWALVAPLLGLVAVGAVRSRGRARLLVWVWLLPPALALASVAAGTNVLHKARYFATGSAVLAALLAIGILSLRLPARWQAAVAAACLAAFAAGAIAEIQEPVGTDWRGVVRVLDAERRPGEELRVLPDIPLRLLTLRYYYDGPYRVLGEAEEGGAGSGAGGAGGAGGVDRPSAPGVWIALSPHAFEAARSRDPAAAAAARAELDALEQRFPSHEEHRLRAGTLLHLSTPTEDEP